MRIHPGSGGSLGSDGNYVFLDFSTFVFTLRDKIGLQLVSF